MRPIFTFRWLRRTVRRNMNPIPQDKAADWSIRLSRLYAFFALNTAGLIIYATYRDDLDMWGKASNKMSVVDTYKRLSKGQEIEVVQVRGLQVTNQYTIPPEKSAEESA